MSKINLNNPIKFIPAISMEDKEFKMQEKMNVLAKINLGKLFNQFKKDHVKQIIHIAY